MGVENRIILTSLLDCDCHKGAGRGEKGIGLAAHVLGLARRPLGLSAHGLDYLRISLTKGGFH